MKTSDDIYNKKGYSFYNLHNRELGFFTNSSAASTVPRAVMDYLYVPDTEHHKGILVEKQQSDIEHVPIARLDYVKDMAEEMAAVQA